jgi:hypothetical protein
MSAKPPDDGADWAGRYAGGALRADGLAAC